MDKFAMNVAYTIIWATVYAALTLSIPFILYLFFPLPMEAMGAVGVISFLIASALVYPKNN